MLRKVSKDVPLILALILATVVIFVVVQAAATDRVESVVHAGDTASVSCPTARDTLVDTLQRYVPIPIKLP
ncbi:MAG: hypothetical protein WBK28_00170 [Minisyncoccia bacterium]